MSIYSLNPENIPAVARLMARIKPDWWDEQGGIDQLSDIGNTARNVGWFLGDDERHPTGWLLCAEYPPYSCLSLECLGYDDHGRFVMERPLEPLLRRAEEYALSRGFRMLRYVIGSTELSCHGRPLGDYGEELMNLRSLGRAHYDYFVEYGFRPAGFMPNCLGEHYHGIIMIKELSSFA